MNTSNSRTQEYTRGRSVTPSRERFQVDASHVGHIRRWPQGCVDISGATWSGERCLTRSGLALRQVLSNRRLRLLQIFAPPHLTLSNLPLLARPSCVSSAPVDCNCTTSDPRCRQHSFLTFVLCPSVIRFRSDELVLAPICRPCVCATFFVTFSALSARPFHHHHTKRPSESLETTKKTGKNG